MRLALMIVLLVLCGVRANADTIDVGSGLWYDLYQSSGMSNVTMTDDSSRELSFDLAWGSGRQNWDGYHSFFGFPEGIFQIRRGLNQVRADQTVDGIPLITGFSIYAQFINPDLELESLHPTSGIAVGFLSMFNVPVVPGNTFALTSSSDVLIGEELWHSQMTFGGAIGDDGSGSGTLRLVVTSVPEPSSIVLLSLGCAVIYGLRHRRGSSCIASSVKPMP